MHVATADIVIARARDTAAEQVAVAEMLIAAAFERTASTAAFAVRYLPAAFAIDASCPEVAEICRSTARETVAPEAAPAPRVSPTERTMLTAAATFASNALPFALITDAP